MFKKLFIAGALYSSTLAPINSVDIAMFGVSASLYQVNIGPKDNFYLSYSCYAGMVNLCVFLDLLTLC